MDTNFQKTGGTDEFIRRHTQALKEVSSILEDDDAHSSVQPPFQQHEVVITAVDLNEQVDRDSDLQEVAVVSL